MRDLCLVTVPFSQLNTPSLAIALLAAGTRDAGLDVEHLDIRFRFAEKIGMQRYLQLCATPAEFLIGELVFAAAAFPEFKPDFETAMASLVEEMSDVYYLSSVFGEESFIPLLAGFRDEAVAFIKKEAERVLSLEPKIVGCSSSCAQHCASLALLRRIKETTPQVVTMIGGGNCDGAMGAATSRAFPWVDYVVSGEADHVLAPLCRLVLEHHGRVPPGQLPEGVHHRHHLCDLGASQEYPVTEQAANLDALPYPDYSGYFKALNEYSEAKRVFPAIQLESARGCSWRQKKKGGCTFCGQNGQRETFRQKSPQRLRDEITTMQSRYLGRARVTVMTDTILPTSYYSTLLPDLPSEHTIFWMTDANINEQQMSLLASAHVRVILPGVESFHDGALRLLNKPNSAAGNIALLKFASENGISVRWHFLFGIPGERAEWYEQMAQWLPLVSHLQPPAGMWRLRYDRYSTYHRSQHEYDLTLVPAPAYHMVYPLPDEELNDLAYFFKDATEQRDATCNTQGMVALKSAIMRWQELFARYDNKEKRVVLSYCEDGDSILITDTRPCAVEHSTTLAGVERAVFLACRRPRTAARIVSAVLDSDAGSSFKPEEIEAAARALRERKLILQVHAKLLTLALEEPVRPMVKKKEFLWGYHVDGKFNSM